MIIVIDANIVFSALITPNGKLAKILSHTSLPAKRISCNFLITELLNHQEKIIRSSKMPTDDVMENMRYFLKNIALYNQQLIEQSHWQEAERLTTGVDDFDIPYVALALQKDAWLWTGDKKLTSHLNSMGFDRVLNTNELYNRLETGDL